MSTINEHVTTLLKGIVDGDADVLKNTTFNPIINVGDPLHGPVEYKTDEIHIKTVFIDGRICGPFYAKTESAEYYSVLCSRDKTAIFKQISGDDEIRGMLIRDRIEGNYFKFTNKQEVLVVQFKGNNCEGLHKSTFSDGKPSTMCTFVQDKAHGRFVQYNSSGVLQHDRYCMMNKILGSDTVKLHWSKKDNITVANKPVHNIDEHVVSN